MITYVMGVSKGGVKEDFWVMWIVKNEDSQFQRQDIKSSNGDEGRR